MSLQEPQEQFERESEDPIEEVQNTSDESPLSESDMHAASTESGSVNVPAAERLPLS